MSYRIRRHHDVAEQVRAIAREQIGRALAEIADERPTAPAPRGRRTPAMSLSIGPPSLASAILPRLLSAFAARAHFSTDRIGDVQILSDAIAAHAPRSVAGSHLNAGVDVAPRSMQLCVGPLCDGGAGMLVGHKPGPGWMAAGFGAAVEAEGSARS